MTAMRLAALSTAFLLAACGGGSSEPSPEPSPDAVEPSGDAAGDVGPTDGDGGGIGDGAGDGGEIGEPEPPDPAFVHVVTREPIASASDVYVADEPVYLRTPEQLAGLEVNALAEVDGALYAGTNAGVHRWVEASESFVLLPAQLPTGAMTPVVDIAASLDAEGRLVVAWLNGIGFVDTDTGELADWAPDGGGVLTSVATDGGEVFAGSDTGLRKLVAGVLVPDGAVGVPVHDVAVTAEGEATAATGDTLSLDLEEGELWKGTPAGLSKDGGEEWKAGMGGLPRGDVVAVDARGDWVLMAHEGVGATALRLADPEEIHHYTGLRWLPANDVRAVAIDAAGRFWLGTSKGVARVDRVERTLAAVAAATEADLDQRFWRGGFVASGGWQDDPWTPEPLHLSDFDNDGLWTQMMVGAACYAYAVTKDEAHYQRARKAMDFMFLLVDLPAVDFEAAGLGRGYVARSFVRDDEGALFDQKIPQANWHPVEWTDGHVYRWKDDTSSDEVTGHFFGFPLFYDLCAKDDAERAAVAEHATAITRYIVEGGYLLIDLDGEETTHGHWQPERIAAAVDGLETCLDTTEGPFEWCLESFGGGGWLNSIEILGALLASWHMTGDAFFLDAYEELVTVHRYDEIAMPHDLTVTITEPPFMNHSDHELAMLAYATLLRYEPDPVRRAHWLEGFQFLYEHEEDERNPLWNAFYALAAVPPAADPAPTLPAALRSLREMPPDRRSWLVDNSHRLDAGHWPDDRHDQPQFDTVFPYDEIRSIWWNGNFHVKASGGSGAEVEGPMAWLLPYWALRYGGTLGP